jgi:hypothetical protein
MSFIHEALKRSDRARRLLGASRLEPADATLVPPRRRGWMPWLVLLLVANLGLLAWFSWQAFAPTQPAATPTRLGGEVRSLEREADSGEPVAVHAAPSAVPNPTPTADDGGAPALDALPEAQRSRLPPLHLDAHVWSEDPAQRFAIIDLKRRVVGDALGGGATLVEINADGVVVEVQGRRVAIARQ